MAIKSLVVEAYKGYFFGAIVFTGNCGSIKVQFACVYGSTGF